MTLKYSGAPVINAHGDNVYSLRLLGHEKWQVTSAGEVRNERTTNVRYKAVYLAVGR